MKTGSLIAQNYLIDLYKPVNMVLVLKKGASKKEIESVMKKLRSQKKKGFNARKYNGVLKLKEDPLTIQKRLRGEWERELELIYYEK